MNERSEELLEEAVRWLRVLAAPMLRTTLASALTTTEERRVYQASTGESMKDVGQAAGVSHQTVANYWKKWTASRPKIVEPTVVNGRFRRIYDLDAVDLETEV